MYLYLGNFLSFIGSACLLYSSFSKTKKKLVLFQIIDCIFDGLACLVLGGTSGFIVNAMALLRNGLVFLNLSGFGLATVFSVILCVVSYNFSSGLISVLPVISSVVYSYILCLSKNIAVTKVGLILNQVGWFVFNLYIQAYPSLAVNVLLTLTSLYSIYSQCNVSSKANE